MRRFFFTALILLLLCGAGEAPAAAAAFPEDAQILPDSFLNIYWMDQSLCMGLKQQLFTPVYFTANLDYHRAESDLTFGLGLVYMLPKEELLFDSIPVDLYFYGGAGWQFTRNQGQNNPYLLVGVNYLFLFAESVYPLASEVEPEFRSGFSIKF
ncbi:MAG TPA: hypothetical protein VIL83_03425 [Capillibacterium sp.]